MKFTRREGQRIDVESEGKLLEVIPVITDPSGMPMMLPPVTWHVPNEMLGYADNHMQSMPVQFYMPDRMYIPGSNSASACQLSFLVRLLEDSPSAGVSVATVDADAVVALINAIQEANARRD